MAVKLRLKRMGAKQKPFYRIVAADARSPRDGRFIETVGTYNPVSKPASVSIDEEKALKWLNNGAIPTDTYLIQNIVKNPDLVRVRSFSGDEDATVLEILVSNDDMGAVIGKGGKNAKALRTIILAYAYVNQIKNVKINIDSF